MSQQNIASKEANSEGESIKKDKILQAKEKFIELKAEHEKVILSRDKKMAEAEKRTRDKESQVSGELSKNKKLNDSLEEKIKDYNHRLDILEKKKEELDKLHRSQVEQLEVISSLSAEDAKAQLVESLKGEAKNDAMAYVQSTLEEVVEIGVEIAAGVLGGYRFGGKAQGGHYSQQNAVVSVARREAERFGNHQHGNETDGEVDQDFAS